MGTQRTAPPPIPLHTNPSLQALHSRQEPTGTANLFWAQARAFQGDHREEPGNNSLLSPLLPALSPSPLPAVPMVGGGVTWTSLEPFWLSLGKRHWRAETGIPYTEGPCNQPRITWTSIARGREAPLSPPAGPLQSRWRVAGVALGRPTGAIHRGRNRLSRRPGGFSGKA